MRTQAQRLREWRRRNKEHCRAYRKEWRKINPEKEKQYIINQTIRKAKKEVNKKGFVSFLRKIEKRSWNIFYKMLVTDLGTRGHIRLLKESNKLYREEIKLRKKIGIYEE